MWEDIDSEQGRCLHGLFFSTLSDGYGDVVVHGNSMESGITAWLWRRLRCLLPWPCGVVVYGRVRAICHSGDTNMGPPPYLPRAS